MPEIKMNLQKHAEAKIKLNLSKAGVDEKNIPLMAVFQSVDCSGSMGGLFGNGWVNNLLVVAAGAALTFDDNKSLQVSFFNHNIFTNYPEIDENTEIETYLRDNGIRADGGTRFSNPVKWFLNTDASGYDGGTEVVHHREEVPSKNFFKRLFGCKDVIDRPEIIQKDGEVAPENLPKMLILITDGQAQSESDARETKALLSKMTEHDFVFMIGLGSQFDEAFAKAVTNTANATYYWVREPNKVSSDQLLDQFTEDTKFLKFVKAHQ